MFWSGLNSVVAVGKASVGVAVCVSLCVLILASGTAAQMQSPQWRPISPAELQMAKPLVEPDADAEALIWEVRIDDSSDAIITDAYVRIKIFTERGREKFSKFEVAYLQNASKIEGLHARVIQPDGKITEITAADIFERDIVKASGYKQRAKSFAAPNLVPGAIIEYQFREVKEDILDSSLALDLQLEIPVQTLSYYYKPYKTTDIQFKLYNIDGLKFQPAAGGFFELTQKNVPAFREEPEMPPDKAVRPFVSLQVNWIGVIDLGNFPYISRDKKKIGDARKENEYWPNFAALQKWNISLYRRNKNDFKKLTTEVIGDAATDEEKVRRIYEFCRTKVNNTSYGYELTQKELKKYNAGEWRRIEPGSFSKRTPFGSVHDIRLLFGTMLSAAGIEPWQVFTSRRDEIFFKPEMNDAQFLSSAGIGVMIDGTLKVLDPGQKFQPFGMLSWPREGSVALFTNGEDFGWRQLPISSYEQNRIKRHGRFRLLDDGTLIGEVTIELTGQPALTYRLDHYKDAVPQLEKDLIDSIRARITNAELAHISVENINDIYAPLVQKFSIKVPQYAQRTGTRMIFQPGVFEFGTTPAFSSPRRKYDIFFRYPWSETDDIEIEIPKGFSPDNAESPGEVTASGGISRDKITMSFSPSRSTLVYHRNFFFGGNDAVLFPQASYEGVKTLWDRIHRADTAGFVVRNNN